MTSGTAIGLRFCAFTATSRPLSRRTFMQPCTSGHADDVCGIVIPVWPLSSTCLVRSASNTLVPGFSFSNNFCNSSLAPLLAEAFFLPLLLEEDFLFRLRPLLRFLLRLLLRFLLRLLLRFLLRLLLRFLLRSRLLRFLSRLRLLLFFLSLLADFFPSFLSSFFLLLLRLFLRLLLLFLLLLRLLFLLRLFFLLRLRFLLRLLLLLLLRDLERLFFRDLDLLFFLLDFERLFLDLEPLFFLLDFERDGDLLRDFDLDLFLDLDRDFLSEVLHRLAKESRFASIDDGTNPLILLSSSTQLLPLSKATHRKLLADSSSAAL